MLNYKILIVLITAIFLLTACHKDEKNLNEKLQGKWISMTKITSTQGTIGSNSYIFSYPLNSNYKGRKGHLFIKSGRDPNFDTEYDYKISGNKIILDVSDKITYEIENLTDTSLYFKGGIHLIR